MVVCEGCRLLPPAMCCARHGVARTAEARQRLLPRMGCCIWSCLWKRLTVRVSPMQLIPPRLSPLFVALHLMQPPAFEAYDMITPLMSLARSLKPAQAQLGAHRSFACALCRFAQQHKSCYMTMSGTRLQSHAKRRCLAYGCKVMLHDNVWHTAAKSCYAAMSGTQLRSGHESCYTTMSGTRLQSQESEREQYPNGGMLSPLPHPQLGHFLSWSAGHLGSTHLPRICHTPPTWYQPHLLHATHLVPAASVTRHPPGSSRICHTPPTWYQPHLSHATHLVPAVHSPVHVVDLVAQALRQDPGNRGVTEKQKRHQSKRNRTSTTLRRQAAHHSFPDFEIEDRPVEIEDRPVVSNTHTGCNRKALQHWGPCINVCAHTDCS